MKILAIELSTSRRSVSAWNSEGPLPPSLAVRESIANGRNTQVFEMIRRALEQSELGSDQIELVAIGLGPGSYTGIRVAISIAQGWAAARNVPVVGVPALDILAAEAVSRGIQGRMTLGFDAQRGEVYAARLIVDAGAWTLEEPLGLISAAEAINRLASGEPVLGPDLAALVPGSEACFPGAGTLMRLGLESRVPTEPRGLEPVYLRSTEFKRVVQSR